MLAYDSYRSRGTDVSSSEDVAFEAKAMKRGCICSQARGEALCALLHSCLKTVAVEMNILEVRLGPVGDYAKTSSFILHEVKLLSSG